jgi:hypothetical protein
MFGRRKRGNVQRTLFLHAGTHKTGTTSLQDLMARNARRFRKAGVLYPESGRRRTPVADAMSGQHHIAWELNGDARFDPRAGTLAQLLDELRASAAPVAVVSSEDFEYLHRRPERLERLASGVRAAGYAARVVLFLRPQADYAESLYAELVQRHGLDRGFESYLAEIDSAGSFAFREWNFAFDYDVLLRSFEDAFGADALVVRSYNRGGTADALPREFVGLFAPRELDFRRLVQPEWLHEAPSFRGVLESLQATLARLGRIDLQRDTVSPEMLAIGADPSAFAGRFDVLTPAAASAIDDRFRASNERVAARYALPALLSPSPSAVAGDERRRLRAEVFRAAARRWNIAGAP